jgi:hypothetical protein
LNGVLGRRPEARMAGNSLRSPPIGASTWMRQLEQFEQPCESHGDRARPDVRGGPGVRCHAQCLRATGGPLAAAFARRAAANHAGPAPSEIPCLHLRAEEPRDAPEGHCRGARSRAAGINDPGLRLDARQRPGCAGAQGSSPARVTDTVTSTPSSSTRPGTRSNDPDRRYQPTTPVG